jgi:FAD/FMN-containing dehydrogenase
MQDFAEALAGIVGAPHVLTAPEDQAAYTTDWLKSWHGRAAAVVRPTDTLEVAAVMRLCHERRVPVVPQGGNTGMSGGATPDASGRAVILSLIRMNAIRAVDLVGDTITVEAGCVLARVQEAARVSGRLFSLSLGAEGSCTIGGNLATNAGGINVLAYGTAREQVLGLEVVLADGRIWDGLAGLRKDNSGYALRDLFVGSEGTLGIITAAVLKLRPAAGDRATAMVALGGMDEALRLLASVKREAGGNLTAFEFMTGECFSLVLRHVAGSTPPFAARPDAVVLIELSGTGQAALDATLEAILAGALADGLASDAVVAQSGEQANGLWRLREGISEAQVKNGKTIKHDIALPIAALPDFIREAEAAIAARFPGLALLVFGHLGDGNLHYNLQRAPGMSEADFLALAAPLSRIVHDLVGKHRGSISAEHGIGQLRRDELARLKSPVALDMMRGIKAQLDPHGILNPGKLL